VTAAQGKISDTHWKKGWVSPTAGPDSLEERISDITCYLSTEATAQSLYGLSYPSKSHSDMHANNKTLICCIPLREEMNGKYRIN
jgi:hypothetical protein